MSRFNINGVIYFYMFVCILLLLFNVFYILSAEVGKWLTVRRSQNWKSRITKILEAMRGGQPIPEEHIKEMARRLKNTDRLMAYNKGVAELEKTPALHEYFRQCYNCWVELGLYYKGKEPMERAYFADTMACYAESFPKEDNRIAMILLSYLNNSTIFCRENVLRGLYAFGSSEVETALRYIADNQLYHSPKLLSDGLMTYTGDKQALIERLWRNFDSWPEYIQVAIVQLITQTDLDYADVFLNYLNEPKTSKEIKFAMIRYFRRHPAEKARSYLLDCAEKGEDLAIVAATVLACYPGVDSRRALEKLLVSPNWYIRKNAAAALLEQGISDGELREIYGKADRYGRDILRYCAGSRLEEEDPTCTK